MNILGWLALIFLTLAGYSAGAVLGSRTRTNGHRGDPSPSLLDTAMVVVLWIGGIASQLAGVKPWAAVGVWLVLAIAAAFVINQVKKQPSEGKPLPQ